MVECVKIGKRPVYEVECFECGSLLRYTKADVSLIHITCPVCGCSVMVSYNRVDDTESTVTEATKTDNKKKYSCGYPYPSETVPSYSKTMEAST